MRLSGHDVKDVSGNTTNVEVQPDTAVSCGPGYGFYFGGVYYLLPVNVNPLNP